MAHSTSPLFTLFPSFSLQFPKSLCNSLNKWLSTYGVCILMSKYLITILNFLCHSLQWYHCLFLTFRPTAFKPAVEPAPSKVSSSAGHSSTPEPPTAMTTTANCTTWTTGPWLMAWERSWTRTPPWTLPTAAESASTTKIAANVSPF